MTDALLYATIWLAVVAWAAAEVLRRGGGARPAARLVWTAGAALLAVHTAIAFDSRHGWSHDAAYASTAMQSAALTGVAAGWGLYLNYAFVIIWLADAAWWWAAPAAYERRSRAADRARFAFFFFMMVNGAVVFAVSRMRWVGVVCVAAALAARVWPRRRLAAERK
jgi:hypothetical protein